VDWPPLLRDETLQTIFRYDNWLPRGFNFSFTLPFADAFLAMEDGLQEG